MDILFMQTHYPTLYVPSDVSHVFRHAVMNNGETIPYTNIIRYNVTSSSQVCVIDFTVSLMYNYHIV